MRAQPTFGAHATRHLSAIMSATMISVALPGGAICAAATAHSTAPLVFSSLTTKHYGTILQSSRTVYTLSPSKVPCGTTCVTYWPEVLLPKGTTRALAAHGVNAAKLGTIKRAGGRLQVTYAGKALYWFALDTAPGQVRGNLRDTWGAWSVVTLVKSPSTTTTIGGSGGGIGF